VLNPQVLGTPVMIRINDFIFGASVGALAATCLWAVVMLLA
jgi:hypothetical protein